MNMCQKLLHVLMTQSHWDFVRIYLSSVGNEHILTASCDIVREHTACMSGNHTCSKWMC